MAEFDITWNDIREVSVSIEADSAEEAFKKWQEGEYGRLEVNDEDVYGDSIEIDGVEYYAGEFKRIFRGAGNGTEDV